MSEQPHADLSGDEYAPAGEAQGQGATFGADELARAFGVAVERVHRALAGEYGLQPGDRVDSKGAQNLAEALLADQPLDRREAALMELGAFTPRPDQVWGMGETPPTEESDRYAASADEPDDVRASRRGSHDPAYPSG